MATKLVFEDYDAYGFDIDNTLAKYNIPNLFDTVYASMAAYLVDVKGYAKDIMSQPFSIHADFCTRGIVLDNKKGNFLKLSENGYIFRASHGTRFMSDDEIKEEYGKERLWPHYEELIDKVNNLDDRARVFENFFDMPLMVVSARLVDVIDRDSPGRDYFLDVYHAAEYIYGQDQFRLRKGGFFDKWRENTADYLYPCSDRVRAWLHKLRSQHRQMFLLTSSRADYAIESMKFILGEDWKDLFDLMLTDAKKPGFFQKNRNFLDISGNAITTEQAENLSVTETYAQGNAEQLTISLQKLTGKKNPKILFFGDSMRSDAAPAKHTSGWDTVLILEEIIAEHHPETGLDIVESQVNYPTTLEKKYLTSHSWGSLFTDEIEVVGKENDDNANKVKYMNTLWGYVIRKYADLAIPQLEYIVDFNFDHEFEVFDHTTLRSWGFYPYIPIVLR